MGDALYLTAVAELRIQVLVLMGHCWEQQSGYPRYPENTASGKTEATPFRGGFVKWLRTVEAFKWTRASPRESKCQPRKRSAMRILTISSSKPLIPNDMDE